MLKIKDISWVRIESGYDTISHSAIIQDKQFLCIIEIDDDPNENFLSVFSGKKDDDKYYIHTTSHIFDVRGNQGIEKWGWFSNLEDCKSKAEELIKEGILSFIDMRDYKIREVLNGNS